LKESIATFRVLLDLLPDAVVIVDRNGRICRGNAQVEKVFGYAWVELLGKPVEALIPHVFGNATSCIASST